MKCTMFPNRIKLRDVVANSREITRDPIIGEVTSSHEVRFVFLDVDGTINHPSSGATAICTFCVQKLKQILDQTHAKIVLSSTWRLADNQRSILFYYLRYFGIEEGSVIGQTRDLRGDNKNRTDEIRDWLQRPNFYCETNPGWKIVKWVSLDDMNLAEMEMDTKMRSRHVQVNPHLGLCKTIDVVDRVVRELQKIELCRSLDNNARLSVGLRDCNLPSSVTVPPNKHKCRNGKRRYDKAHQVVTSNRCSEEGSIKVLSVFINKSNSTGDLFDECSESPTLSEGNKQKFFPNKNPNRRTRSLGSMHGVRTVRLSSPGSIERRCGRTLSEWDDLGRLR